MKTVLSRSSVGSTTDPGIKRLRWIMLCVMLFDLLITLAGQPVIYWVNPTAVIEGNPVVRVVMQRGILPLLLASLVYAAVVVGLVSTLPKRVGLGLLLLVTVGHFYGASSWLQFRYHYAYGSVIYGVILVTLLIAAGLDTRQTPAVPAKHSRFAGSTFAAVFCIIFIGSGVLILRGLQLNRDASAYIQGAVPAIAGRWSPAELVNRATSDALAATSSAELDHLFKLGQQLGSLKELRRPLANGDSISFVLHGRREGVRYTVHAQCEKGLAVIQLHIREVDNAWKIERFRISSASFNAQVPAKSPPLGTRLPP